MDQTNPLAQLTHERRLSALGPGGLNRKRAGFEVRDVHISHYGRICPIETPEGTNIGLISSLSIYAEIDEYGFLITPYRKVKNKKLTDDVVKLRADEEAQARARPGRHPDRGRQDHRRAGQRPVSAATSGRSPADKVEYIDVSPEADGRRVGRADPVPGARRRQPGPDGLEHAAAGGAAAGHRAAARRDRPGEGRRPATPAWSSGPSEDGTVAYVDAERIKIEEKDKIVREYVLRKFHGLNERTCLNQKPIVKMGEKVKKGQIIADGAATHNGELALGRNVLVAFMSWEGYNFEDAIIISERLVKNDTYTSIHIEEFEIEIRETKLGKEEFTRDIPNVSPEGAVATSTSTASSGSARSSSPATSWSARCRRSRRSELTPEEKLLHAIFGRAGEDVKNDSLEVPSGVEGIVIDTQRFSRRASMTEDEKKEIDKRAEGDRDDVRGRRSPTSSASSIDELAEVLDKKELKDPNTGKALGQRQGRQGRRRAGQGVQAREPRHPQPGQAEEGATRSTTGTGSGSSSSSTSRSGKLNSLKRGDELPSGVQQMVKVYVATKRVISVGDKMAGRHGNKGVISKVLPEEDMPFLADGTPVDILLNPLGVPSRMNVGQILETHLGYAAAKLGLQGGHPGVRRGDRGGDPRRR